MDINEYRYDLDLCEKGVWKDLGIGGAKVKVKSPLCEAYVTAEEAAFRAIRSRYPGGTLPVAIAVRTKAAAIVEEGLVDWSDITKGGEEVPFSKEAARTVFSEEFQDIMLALIDVFAERKAFLVKNQEDRAENLSLACNGT